MSEATNIVEKIVMSAGGYEAFAKRMGGTMSRQSLREIVRGNRVPTAETRRRMVKASRGRLGEADVISITGRFLEEGANPMWDADEDELRHWIWERATQGAREQRKRNRRVRR